MKRIRIGKTINCKWTITVNGETKDLSGEAINVFVKTPIGKSAEITGITIQNNVVYFAYKPLMLGNYILTLYLNKDAENEGILDKVAFNCCRYTFNEIDDTDSNIEYESLDLEGDIIYGKSGIEEETDPVYMADKPYLATKDELKEIDDKLKEITKVTSGEITVPYSYGNNTHIVDLPLGIPNIKFDINSAAPMANWHLILSKYPKGSSFPIQEFIPFIGKFTTTIDTTGDYDRITCMIKLTSGVMYGYAVITYDKKNYYTADDINEMINTLSTKITSLRDSMEDLSIAVDDLSYKVEECVSMADYEANKTYVENELDKKQPVGDYTLRTDFKTINGESILGEGDIII